MHLRTAARAERRGLGSVRPGDRHGRRPLVLKLAAPGQAGPDLRRRRRLVFMSSVPAERVDRVPEDYRGRYGGVRSSAEPRTGSGHARRECIARLDRIPCDRITARRRPTMLCGHGCRGVLGVLLPGPGGSVRAQGAHCGGEQPGFGRDVPRYPRVCSQRSSVVGAVGGHARDGRQDGPHMGGDVQFLDG